MISPFRQQRLVAALDRALQNAVLTIRDIAAGAGFSYDALMKWRSGRRNPGPEALRAIAETLEQHRSVLKTVADDLREEADRAERD